MKKMQSLLAAALLCCGLFTTGCKSLNLADVAAQLKDDHSNLRIVVATPWGTQTIDRTNPYPPAPGTNTQDSVTITPAATLNVK